MGVFKKLSQARALLQKNEIKKSGYNSFGKWNYMELSDFLPFINQINSELGLCTIFQMREKVCTLQVIDVEDNSEIKFTIDRVEADVKGAQKIQLLGGTQTYLRRYLFISAYEISESDGVDSLPPQEKEDEKAKEKAINMIVEIYKKDNLKYNLSDLKSKTKEELSDIYKSVNKPKDEKEDILKSLLEIAKDKQLTIDLETFKKMSLEELKEQHKLLK